MWKSSVAGFLILGLLTAGSLATPGTAVAQGAQYNETDLEFSRRMIARVESVEARAKKLEKSLNPESGLSMNRSTQPGTDRTRDEYGQPRRDDPFSSRDSTGTSDRLIKSKLRTLQSKATTEHKKLTAVQGSKSKPEELDRESIESRVARMERDIADVEKDLRRR
jgi:hypothetical protein